MPEGTNARSELYSARTLYTLGGSSSAVWVFTTLVGWIFKFNLDNYRWIGLIVAMILSFVGAFRVAKVQPQLMVVAFFNGLLIYLTSVGMNAINQGIASGNNSQTHATFFGMKVDQPWWPTRTLADSVTRLHGALSYSEHKNAELIASAESLQELVKNLQLGQKNGLDDRYVAKLNSVQLELEKCRRQFEQVIKKQPTPSDKVISVLRSLGTLKKMNSALMHNLEEFLDQRTPVGSQKNALEQAITNADVLKDQLEAYNMRVEEMIKSLQ